MANFIAEIVNVGEVENVANNRGGSYAKMDVLYKNRKTGKVESKNLVEFNNKAVFNTARSARKGDVYTITLDKNAKGYWEWTNLSAGESEGTETSNQAGVSPIPAQSFNTRAVSTAVPKTYETADERAKRQKLIVAQSSISNAIETLKSGKGLVDPQGVINFAEIYYKWVMSKQVDFADMKDDLV